MAKHLPVFVITDSLEDIGGPSLPIYEVPVAITWRQTRDVTPIHTAYDKKIK